MSGGFTVDPDVLDAHATKLGEYADWLGDASTLARPLGRAAYGLVGQAFATSAVQAAAQADRAVGVMADTGQVLPTAMRATAAAYRAVEEQIVAALGRTC